LHLLGVEYAPSEDDSMFSASVLMPYGTALATTDAAVSSQLVSIPKMVHWRNG